VTCVGGRTARNRRRVKDWIEILYSKTSEAMKKDLQEAFEKAIAGYEKRQGGTSARP
jgi:hypothetical protein